MYLQPTDWVKCGQSPADRWTAGIHVQFLNNHSNPKLIPSISIGNKSKGTHSADMIRRTGGGVTLQTIAHGAVPLCVVVQPTKAPGAALSIPKS